MISIDLQKYKSELSDFLSIGRRWLFVPGYVYTTNDAKNVFARMTMSGLEADEAIDPLMIMDKLEGVLQRKTVKTVKIAVKSGFLMIDTSNLVAQIPIAREDRPDEVKKLHEYNEKCMTIIDSEDGCQFDVHRDVFLDALDTALSPKEPIRIDTGNSVKITSDSGQLATLPKVHASPETSITLSMEAQEKLRTTLSGASESIRIKIIDDGPYCIFHNPRLTVMAGGMVRQ